MKNKIITSVFFLALISSVFSCKDKQDANTVVLDATNRVVAENNNQYNKQTLKKSKFKPGEYPVIEITNSSFDFGTITQGDKVEHIFIVKNTGKNDLLILEVQPTCGCTIPQWTKNPIPKGQTGQIKIVFNSQGKTGLQNKSIYLITNTLSGTETINFKANVTPKTK